MGWLVKVFIFVLLSTAAAGAVVSLLDKLIAASIQNRSRFKIAVLEPIFLASLKLFIISYLTLFTMAVFAALVVSFYALQWSFSMPPEYAPYSIILSFWLGISALLVLPTALKKGVPIEPPYLMKASPQTEPRLFELIEDISERLSTAPPEDVVFTPGAKIELRAEAKTFDDVFSGAQGRLEIGLAAFEFLSAIDLSILLARQLLTSDDEFNPLGAFINRLQRRFEIIERNVIQASPLLYLNPAAWAGIAANSIVDLISWRSQAASELILDDQVAHIYGKARLKAAIARYGIESERLRGLIIEGKLRHRSGLQRIGNVYDSMRQGGFENARELLAFSEKFYDLHHGKISFGKSGTTRLRLKRLPEIADISLDINVPAGGFLNNLRKTEELMLELLNS